MTSEMNSFNNMTTTSVYDKDEEMNVTGILNETSTIENLLSPIANLTTNNNVDSEEEMTIGMYSVLCIKAFIFGSIIIGAVLGNALVILAVRRNRKLR